MTQVLPLMNDVPAATATVASILADHGSFVWLTLQRLGVRPADLEDVMQEVFVVVHRRLGAFEGRAKITTWLFGICLRVASDHRRRAHVRREELRGDALDEAAVDPSASPEEVVAARQALATLRRALDELELEKRAVFVMAEIDGVRHDEIAAMLGVPVGTVGSRLHAARRALARAIARHRAGDGGGGGW